MLTNPIEPPPIEQLKKRIREIERSPADARALVSHAGNLVTADHETAWTLGPRWHRLETAAVHEIKPVDPGSSSEVDWASAWAAARNFALALAGRRLKTCDRGKQDADILWCTSTMMTSEFGTLYGPGLAAFGLDPARIIVVEVARWQDALWALEQGLKSGSLALAIAQIDEIDLTPARRLALAATSSATPCLAITHPRSPATAASATRWRIAPAPSSIHPFDPNAPGAPRFVVTLERCRGRSSSADDQPFLLDQPLLLEWCNAAYRFSLAPSMADRTHAAGHPARPRHALS